MGALKFAEGMGPGREHGDRGINQDLHRLWLTQMHLGATPRHYPGKVQGTHRVPRAEPRPLSSAELRSSCEDPGVGPLLFSLSRGGGPGASSLFKPYAAPCARFLAQAGLPHSGLASQAQKIGDNCSGLRSGDRKETRAPVVQLRWPRCLRMQPYTSSRTCFSSSHLLRLQHCLQDHALTPNSAFLALSILRLSPLYFWET